MLAISEWTVPIQIFTSVVCGPQSCQATKLLQTSRISTGPCRPAQQIRWFLLRWQQTVHPHGGQSEDCSCGWNVMPQDWSCYLFTSFHLLWTLLDSLALKTGARLLQPIPVLLNAKELSSLRQIPSYSEGTVATWVPQWFPTCCKGRNVRPLQLEDNRCPSQDIEQECSFPPPCDGFKQKYKLQVACTVLAQLARVYLFNLCSSLLLGLDLFSDGFFNFQATHIPLLCTYEILAATFCTPMRQMILLFMSTAFRSKTAGNHHKSPKTTMPHALCLKCLVPESVHCCQDLLHEKSGSK